MAPSSVLLLGKFESRDDKFHSLGAPIWAFEPKLIPNKRTCALGRMGADIENLRMFSSQ